MRLTMLSLLTLTACSGISEFTEPHDTAGFVADTDNGGDTDGDTDTGAETDTVDTDTGVETDTDTVDTDTGADTDTADTSPTDSGGDTVVDTGPGVDTGPVDTATADTDSGADTDPTDTDIGAPVDVDADGFTTADGDCDDANATVFPGADERCNALDDDCDGVIDPSTSIDALTVYLDADADGFGDAEASWLACEVGANETVNPGDCDDADARYSPVADESDCTDPADYNCDGSTGYVDADGDGYAACAECDDTDADAFPGAEELCNGQDDDCDGSLDEGAFDATLWFADLDADGFGDAAAPTLACDAPLGASPLDSDCDDASALVFPDAPESCNGVDDDCDGTLDEGALDASLWFADDDGDGFGDASATATACAAPSGYVASPADCDDGDGAVSPDGVESCNSVDDDCDGTVDGGATDAIPWYADVDRDGYGDAANVVIACAAPARRVANANDCDDGDVTVHPNALEFCNGTDDDCDGVVDPADAGGATPWYADADRDSFGDPAATVSSCEQPTGFVAGATDCDDTTATTFPGADETCNAVDDDCDGTVDPESALDAGTVYADADGDGYGDDAVVAFACAVDAGWSALGGDCDDADAAYNPGAVEADCTDPADYNCDGSTRYADADADGFAACEECDDTDASAFPGADEACNGRDDDCDGTVDQDAIDGSAWYADADGDGYGDAASTTLACDAPLGYTADDGDCDDGDGAVSPDGIEVCNEVDDDCDGTVDLEATAAPAWYADADADGFGDAAVEALACEAPADFVDDASDCDDATATTFPGADETCNDVDDDCDGTVDPTTSTDATIWYADADADGAGDPVNSTYACTVPAGFVLLPDDCDDTDAGALPGGVEVCDSVDNDCNGSVDDAALDSIAWYADADADGYGDLYNGGVLCEAPEGYVTDATDCADDSAAHHPGAVELCNDGDNDCDGDTDEDALDASDWHFDADGDGYGDGSAAYRACAQPGGYVADGTDCGVDDPTIHPGAEEWCNTTDDDCDGTVDESAMDPGTYYLDLDGDGVGEEGVTAEACALPNGFAASFGDCDDEDATVYPGAQEVCDDGLDQDCSGAADDDGVCYGCIEVDGYLLCEPETRALSADTCTLLGSQLVTVDDEVENAALVEAMASLNVYVTWIGLNDLTDEGDYLWADATPASWTNWSSGDPNDADGSDDCVVMVPDGTWVDVSCSYGFNYICE